MLHKKCRYLYAKILLGISPCPLHIIPQKILPMNLSNINPKCYLDVYYRVIKVPQIEIFCELNFFNQ